MVSPGGGTLNIFGWGCAARSWKPLPYFRPKYTIFRTLFQTWLSKCIPYFRPCDVWYFQQLSMDLRRTGTMFLSFFLAINVHGNTRYPKNGIPDQTDGIYTLFQTRDDCHARSTCTMVTLSNAVPLRHHYLRTTLQQYVVPEPSGPGGAPGRGFARRIRTIDRRIRKEQTIQFASTSIR